MDNDIELFVIISTSIYLSIYLCAWYLDKKAAVSAGRVVGRQVGSNQQEFGVVGQLYVCVGRQS